MLNKMKIHPSVVKEFVAIENDLDKSIIGLPEFGDAIGARCILECTNCKSDIYVDFFSHKDLDKFTASLELKKPDRFVWCKKCNYDIN